MQLNDPMTLGSIQPGAVKVGKSYEERRKLMTDLLKDPTREPESYTITFDGKQKAHDVISVPIDLPKYRLANGRTLSLQDEFIAGNDSIKEDFFSADVEHNAAQVVQHGLLLKMVENTALEAFFVDAGERQTQPIELDNDGIVVNGNRRLAFWRYLHALDNKKYAHFSTIKAIRLPVADEKAILDLERRLQLAPELRVDYPWHALAVLYEQEIQGDKERLKRLAKQVNQPPVDVRRLIDARYLAAEYLNSREINGRWSHLDNWEYAFRQIATQRDRYKADIGKQTLIKSLAFKLVDDGSAEGSSAYRLIKNIGDYIDDIAAEMQSELEVKEDDKTDSEPTDVDDVLGPASDKDEESGPTLIDIATAVDNSDDHEKVVDVVEDTIQSVANKAKQKNKQKYLAAQVKIARTAFDNAVNAGLSSEANTAGVESQLCQIEVSIKKIREFLDD